jgi:predicted translin family RNA/ssDNA-binding protein
VQKRLESTRVHCSEQDYLLGLTDLTGELMRYGLAALGNTGIQEGEAMVSMTEEWVRQIRGGQSVPSAWRMLTFCQP